ncbi:hypothetical protein [Pseudovibrio sp. SPO723]|uniref:hypothetical protein n=1 Tax=Nesiotobacter zosterae TaxID=392721 RepID=UPI0029C12DE0|nr:hypothetical protein [Pseudovibrio sp. SPO723]MDX5592283.1 hypothetical protein [Pseudovibrio sp. SPO723]
MRIAHAAHLGWQPLEKRAFGLIYGAILVLSLLMALGDTPEAPFEPALVLFGSVLAVTLVRSFAALLSHAMETGERMLTLKATQTAWSNNHPMLIVANAPTALFIAGGLEWLTMQTATMLSQAFCVAILIILGARVGWVINHSCWLAFGGALFAGGLGSGLAALKYAIQ